MEKDTSCDTEETTNVKQPKIDLDYILQHEVGQFGFWQIKNIIFLAIVVLFVQSSNSEYIFSTARIKSRCLIPECESPASAEFSSPWLEHAVPAAGAGLDNCRRFGNTTYTDDAVDLVCPASLFDKLTVKECEQYVYEHNNTVVYDLDLACNEWKRTLIGSLRSVGAFIGMPVVGFLSDRWGRRTMVIIVTVGTGIFGCVRYWTDTYVGFVAVGMVECIVGAGGYLTSYTLAIESVGSKHRMLASIVLSSLSSTGKMSAGLISWVMPSWRLRTAVIYAPQVLFIFYYWLVTESIRWYISKGRYNDAQKALIAAARSNGNQLSEESLKMLWQSAENEKIKQMEKKQKSVTDPWLIVLVFRHKPILLRCLATPVLWITTLLVNSGLNINSVNISGNMYVNYISVSSIDILGYWIALVLATRLGRRSILTAAYWTCAACLVAYIYIPADNYGLALTVYLIGKCSSAMTVTTLYAFTAELFPTRYRSSLVSYSSTIGKLGSILAPLTPALGDTLPFILFASFGLTSGLLVFFMPETRDSKLVDTMEEASHLGKEK